MATAQPSFRIGSRAQLTVAALMPNISSAMGANTLAHEEDAAVVQWQKLLDTAEVVDVACPCRIGNRMPPLPSEQVLDAKPYEIL